MKNKVKKIIISTILIILIFNIVNILKVNAFDANFWKPDELNLDESGEYLTTVNKIIGYFQRIGAGIAIIALMILGIKYLLRKYRRKSRI